MENSVPQTNDVGRSVLHSSPACFPPPLFCPAVIGQTCTMERAARLIKRHKYSSGIIEDAAIIQGIWPTAVGKAIARHTGAVKIVRDCLVVEVEDALWQKQLHSLSGQIIERIQKLTGSDTIQRIEFRVGIPRRPAQRAEVRAATASPVNEEVDEADRIEDPVLKRLYRLSRKRATA